MFRHLEQYRLGDCFLDMYPCPYLKVDVVVVFI
jgi:hypothetical protein